MRCKNIAGTIVGVVVMIGSLASLAGKAGQVKPPVEIRKMAILGTCLPGCEEMWKELGGTHFYGNRFGWPDYDEAERLGMKVFVNIRGQYGYPTEAEITRHVEEWKDRAGCGGYWCDQLGHEPDITNPPIDERIRFYRTVRKYDPDKQNHPVMEMFDQTEADDFPDNQYPGWKNAFSDKTHDLLLFDCYPALDKSDEEIQQSMERTWDKFISTYPHTHQVVPQMAAFGKYRRGSIWVQYTYWKKKMSSPEFNNPYRGAIAVCFYKDETIRKDPEMRDEIKEVIADVMK